MKFLIILKSNLKRTIKSKSTIVSTFIVPLVLISIFGYIFNRIGNSENENMIINSDKGQYGQEFIKEIQKSSKIKVSEKEAGMEAVKKKRVPICYEIPENFSELITNGERPQITAYKREKGAETGNFGFNASSLINKMLLRQELKAQGLEIGLPDLSYEGAEITVSGMDKKRLGDIVTINMIVSFVLFGSIAISTELAQLKRQNVLKRSFTTSNNSGTIIGAILLALFLVSSVAYSIIFVLNCFIVSHSYLSKAPIVILNIAALVLVSLSLGVFVTRLFKNENITPIVMQVIISLTCFVGGSFMPAEFLPKGIQVFSKFVPQYWALRSINTGNSSLSLIVVLFALVLFTAGTFKARNFID